MIEIIQKRSLNILKLIINSPDITIEEIMLKKTLSRRQINYSIENINSWLVANAYGEIERNFGGKLQVRENVKAIINDLLEGNVQYIFDESGRQKIIFFYMYLHYETISLNHLIDILKLSRGTIHDDLKKLTALLEPFGISIQYTRENGYELIGEERQILYVMMNFLVEIISYEEVLYMIQVIIRESDMAYFNEFKCTLQDKLSESELFVSDNNLNIISYIYIIYTVRGRQISLRNKEKLHREVENTVEYKVSEETLKDIEHNELQDIEFLTSLLLSYSTKKASHNSEEDYMIDNLIVSVLERLQRSYAVVLKDKDTIFAQLRAHIRPAIFRMYFNYPMVNPLKDEIMSKYGPIYTIIENLLQVSNFEVFNAISEDDIAYLTIHFATFISDTKTTANTSVSGAIVCPSGIGISVLLRKELMELFPEVHFIDSISIAELEDVGEQVDVVFSTVLVETDKTLFLVNPVMNNIEKVNLVKNFNSRFGTATTEDSINVTNLMKIIKQYADNIDEEALIRELSNLLSYGNHIGIRSEQPMLSEITNTALIQLNVDAKDWQEAISKSAQVLIDNGKVTEDYVVAMIRSKKENGPYIVITEHVALPHARPEDGVLETAISIATLKEPVVFGHETNDPVKYIFCLSTTDNSSHLKALAELVELLDDKDFYELLDSTENTQEIYDYIESKEE